MTEQAVCYDETVKATGIVPEEIYARCSSLLAMPISAPPVRPMATKPAPGQKPINRRGRKKP